MATTSDWRSWNSRQRQLGRLRGVPGRPTTRDTNESSQQTTPLTPPASQQTPPVPLQRRRMNTRRPIPTYQQTIRRIHRQDFNRKATKIVAKTLMTTLTLLANVLTMTNRALVLALDISKMLVVILHYIAQHPSLMLLSGQNTVDAMKHLNNTNRELFLVKTGLALISQPENILVYEDVRTMNLELQFDAPLLSVSSSCSSSKLSSEIKLAEAELMRNEFADLLVEAGVVESQEAIREANFTGQMIWSNGGRMCDEDETSCIVSPLTRNGKLVPCKSSQARATERQTGECQQLEAESLCCSTNARRTGCGEFAAPAVSLIAKQLSGPTGRELVNIGQGKTVKARTLPAWCLKIDKVSKNNETIFQREIRTDPQMRKRRSTLQYWSLGGPFNSHYIDDRVERVNLTSTLRINELAERVSRNEEIVLRLEQSSNQIETLRNQVCQAEASYAASYIYMAMRNLFRETRAELELAVEQCSSGEVPTVFHSRSLSKLCSAVSSNTICYRAPRTVFSCESYSIKMVPTGLAFLVKVRLMSPIPEAETSIVQLLNVGRYLEPKRDNINVYRRLKGLPKYLVLTGEKSSDVWPAYTDDDCSTVKGTLRCNLHNLRSAHTGQLKCVRALVADLMEADDAADPADVCPFEDVVTERACRLRASPLGYILATATDLDVVISSRDGQVKSTCKAGHICRVNVPADGSAVLTCDGRLVTLESTTQSEKISTDEMTYVINGTDLSHFGTKLDQVSTGLRRRGLLKSYDNNKNSYLAVTSLLTMVIVMVICVKCLTRFGFACCHSCCARLPCRRFRRNSRTERWVAGQVVNTKCDT